MNGRLGCPWIALYEMMPTVTDKHSIAISVSVEKKLTIIAPHNFNVADILSNAIGKYN